ncbi:sulfate permease and related transporter (MFS superfamily) [Gynuella sunshinyii YC6258]|uniref:Sulfate permease and related transporter (MFS superfamily) n=2 Tax=Gynuella sunshinyii TaxID=1445505 RepID=A0A0C5VNT3_9GAMM|nr:sulfate permease and related transporter (MFS superfamily) [Gynuella sunshinyii YC6258]
MGNTFNVPCPEMMGINNVDEIKNLLTEAIDSHSDIALQLASVNKIDTTAVQLLIALKQKLESQNNRLILSEPSEQVLKVVKLLGVNTLLGLVD